MEMEISKEEHALYSEKMNSSIFNQNLKIEDVSENEKVYILPGSTIKRLDLRKYLKFHKIKQVFDIKKADYIIAKNYFWNSCQLETHYKIPEREYYNENEDVYKKITGDVWLQYYNAMTFVKTWNNLDDWSLQKKCVEALPVKACLSKINSYFKIEDMFYLINNDFKIIDEKKVKVTLNNWEIKNDIREKISNKEWIAIVDLLKEEDTSEIAIEMLRKINYENVKDQLIMVYFSSDYPVKARQFIKNELFKRDPLLFEKVNHYYCYINRSSYTSTWNIRRSLENCVKVLEDLNFSVDREVFNKIADSNSIVCTPKWMTHNIRHNVT